MKLIYEGPHRRAELFSKIKKQTSIPIITMVATIMVLVIVCFLFKNKIFQSKIDGLSPVVKIEVSGGSGSAILIQNNYLLTAAHVVYGMQQGDGCEVVFQDPNSTDGTILKAWAELVTMGNYSPIDTTANSYTQDFALLKLSSFDASMIPVCNIASSKNVKISDAIQVEGYPNGVYSKTTGTVNNITGGVLENPDLFVVNADAWPGNSGGALLNPNGQLIGIVTAGGSKTSQQFSGQTIVLKIDCIRDALKHKGYIVK